MKTRKLMVASAGFSIILSLFLVVPVDAQVTFGSWERQWFKGTITDKGVIVDDSGTYNASEKTSTYGYISSWDSGNKRYTFLLIQFDPNTDTWMDPVPYVAQVVGGTPLNYVFYGFLPPGAVRGIEVFALIMNATGKEKNGELTKPSAKVIGGCVLYNLTGGPLGPYFAANETLKFDGVPVEKVPDEVLKKIPQP